MDPGALSGGLPDAPIDAAHVFRAAMSALARPGRIETARGARGPAPLSAAASSLLLTLVDPETPVHLAGGFDVAKVRDWITFHTGAPVTGAENATFAVGDWASLAPLSRFRIGSPDYPDRSATLIVELEGLVNAGARLAGPGIETTTALSLPEIEAFQSNRALFPLGLDFFFCAGERLAALPRSTIVEAG